MYAADVWTVNKRSEMIEATKWGAKAILTDRTADFLKLRDEMESELARARVFPPPPSDPMTLRRLDLRQRRNDLALQLVLHMVHFDRDQSDLDVRTLRLDASCWRVGRRAAQSDAQACQERYPGGRLAHAVARPLSLSPFVLRLPPFNPPSSPRIRHPCLSVTFLSMSHSRSNCATLCSRLDSLSLLP